MIELTEKKAVFYRNSIYRTPIAQDIKAALFADEETGGEKLLPKTLATEIVTEPKGKNPLREHAVFTQVTNLEMPRLNFSCDDDEFVEDGEIAKEIGISGAVVQFGRHKMKIIAEVSETVLQGTNTMLVSEIENGLSSAIAVKERKVAFATSPKLGQEHMSFYRAATPQLAAIKVVTGSDMFSAIMNAIADLHEDFRANAKVFMRFTDYLTMIKQLSNGTTSLFNAQPEQIIGKPVVFTDAAVKPVVGDFSYSHFNYDLEAQYDTDKNVKTGMYQFVVTAYFDHQIKLTSAFRLAEVQ